MKLTNIRKTKTGVTTFGCFWDKGTLAKEDVNRLEVIGASGNKVSAQTRITAYWPQGSVKWTAHTALVKDLGDSCEVVKRETPVTLEKGIVIKKDGEATIVEAGKLTLSINPKSGFLFDTVEKSGEVIWKNAAPVLYIDTPVEVAGSKGFVTRECTASVDEMQIEEEGPVSFVAKFTGSHIDNNGERICPFIIRMSLGLNSEDISFTHTFFYDGDENKDYLKGLGIKIDAAVKGELYNRHVKFMNEHGMFHEALVHLTSWRPRVPEQLLKDQIAGKAVAPEGEVLEKVNKVMEDIPYWDEYVLCQDSVSHYGIKKKLAGEDLCYIEALHGYRTNGGAAIGSPAGSTVFAIRDFWEKYPSGYTFKGLTQEFAKCTLWFWSPDAEHMDFRHYATRGYNQVCYEGYDYKGADPYGIAVTNECVISYFDGELIAADEVIYGVTDSQNAPALYVATPEFYHEHKVFGYWSLPGKETETERWIEDQLEKAFSFYQNEVEQRNWYGMFNYGDFMHTYDNVRHTWKYDVGGYAWDNTELVPTLWLWLYFMRTGREDVFTLAEKLSRHASEVDVYHFGKFQGLGSRHNVRHWGCPCKEARIAMAGHHRYMYYLTGDRRLEDIFDELKDNEKSFLNKDPLGDFFDKKDMIMPSHARSGPDWSSLVSNWMMEWERHNDTVYRDKILVGLGDIKKAPLKLSSGPDFEFDPDTCHLGYIGERTTGGCHLQVCMGAPSIWMETADLLEDEEFKEMIAKHGRFYFLSHEDQLKESNGIIGNRESSLPMLSCAMGAYGAAYLKDKSLADTTWKILLETMIQGPEATGYVPVDLHDEGNHENLKEIPWVTTNFTAQWCLNTIMTLDFIREDLPGTIDDVRTLVEGAEPAKLHKS